MHYMNVEGTSSSIVYVEMVHNEAGAKPVCLQREFYLVFTTESLRHGVGILCGSVFSSEAGGDKSIG